MSLTEANAHRIEALCDAAHAAEDAHLCALMARVAVADAAAFATLYDATSSRVFALARKLSSDLPGAEALTEEVYWQAWIQAARFDRARGSVPAWLRMLALNLAPLTLRAGLAERGAVTEDHSS